MKTEAEIRGKEIQKMMTAGMRAKYALKFKLEEEIHAHIMEEIAAATKVGIKQRGRSND